jgi:hypothetical protein
VRLHVVIEKEEEFAACLFCPAVPRGGRSAILLLHHCERERRRQSSQSVGRAIGRPVHDHDHLKRLPEVLGAERSDRCDHDVSPLERRNNDTEPRSHRSALESAFRPEPGSLVNQGQMQRIVSYPSAAGTRVVSGP